MKLNHLEHVEDYMLTGNFIQAVDVIASVAEAVKTKKVQHLKISTKYDGAPAIVFGINPDNGKFFIGTKSVFNKRIPLICYGEEDIISFYDNKPELCEKLRVAFDHLANEYFSMQTMPNGVYQADLMFTRDSVRQDDRTVSFTPNTITYRVNKELPMAKAILNAPLGVVLHTQYRGGTLADMVAHPVDRYEFVDMESKVMFIDPTLDIEDFTITELQYNTIVDSVGYCEKLYGLTTDRSIFTRHGSMLKMFMNHCIRIGELDPSVSMYSVFLVNRKEDDLAKEAMEKTGVFRDIFTMHKHLTYCKKLLIGRMNKFQSFFTEVNGTPTDGEGFVINYHGVMCKFVNRLEFSRLNFANKRYAKT